MAAPANAASADMMDASMDGYRRVVLVLASKADNASK
jgi:hypothetical protein